MKETKQTMTINEMPAPTWNWLKMNGTKVPGFPVSGEGGLDPEIPAGIEFGERPKSAYTDGETGMGEDFSAFMAAQGVPVRTICVKTGRKGSEPVRLSLALEDGRLNRFDLTVGEDAELVVIMKMDGKDEAGSAAVQTRYQIGPRAKLTLAQVITAGEDFRLLDDIGGTAAEDGEMHLIQIVLTGKETYLGHYTGLAGRGSRLRTDLGYLVRGEERLDVNYFADHTGRDTDCEIHAAGVLRDRAFKLFRGTIDFKRGAAGSTGAEKEDVMLMDDDVINQTIPVILCTEEDVEGTHGATIGRLDSEMMFYMQSRGLSEEEIYEMMARARIEAAAAQIPDRAAREDVSLFLNRGGRQKAQSAGRTIHD